MLSNHLKVSFRKIRKYPISSITKIFSLTVGIVGVFFIALYLNHELSYDYFHKKKDRIYRLNTTIASPTGDLHLGLTATGVAEYLQAVCPDVEEVIRINKEYGSHVLQYGDKQFIESENILYADARFFDVFNFELVDGHQQGALDEPHEILLTESAALKYFGKTEVVGELLEYDETPFRVSGVIRDIPSNSHLQFDFLISMETFLESRPNAHENWTWLPMNTFVLLKEGVGGSNFQEKVKTIPAYQNTTSVKNFSVGIEPFAGIHFSEVTMGQLGVSGNLSNIYLLAGVGLMLLLLACFNYINLTTAVMSVHEKEVSVKKTIGASYGNIFHQFMIESVVITGISVLLSLVIILCFFSNFTSFLHLHYGLDYILNPTPLMILGLLPLVLAVAGGLYPAMKFARIKANDMIKNKVNPRGLLDTRSSLLVFQFCITGTLIIGSVIMFAQLTYLKDKDLGFDMNHKVIIDYGPNSQIGNKYEMLTTELTTIPGVESVTFSSHIPGEEPNGVTTVLKDQEGHERSGDINLTLVDHNFISKYGLTIIAGRDFRQGAADVSNSLIVNEACVKAYGFDHPEEILGHSFQQWGGDGKVIGVVSDFNYLSLHQDVGLLSLKVWPDQFQKITLDIKKEDIAATISQLEAKWKTLYPNRPFNYHFLNDSFQHQYEADQAFTSIINVFTGIAICIGLLGLISFTSFWCDRKRREMSIRKILGEHPRGLLWRLYRQFILPVFLGFLMATPIAYYLGRNWIQQFAYQFDLTILVFALPILVILILVSAVILAQTLQLVRANPVQQLKEE